MIRKSVDRLHPYVPGEQPKDPSIIKLNTNENPYPPSPAVTQSLLRDFDLASLRKYPDPVALELREAIAALHGADAAQVIAGNGSDELLAYCTRAFVEPAGSIGYFEPSYSLYPVLSDIADVQTKPMPLMDDLTWQMTPDYEADLFFITQPNAPTSMAHDKETIRAFCKSFRGVVVVDEAYVDFAEFDCVDLAMSLPNVLVMRTFSKSYSLAGIRLGYAIGPEPLIEALFKIKDSYNLNGLTQAAGLAAIKDQHWMKSNVAKVVATRERIAAHLSERGFDVLPSQTNFLFIKPAGETAEALFRRLRERRIIARYFPEGVTSDFLRVTVGTDEEMDAFLAAL